MHWDGKLVPDTARCHDKYDRLPMLVSRNGTENLLAIPKLMSGSIQSMAFAVKKALNKRELQDKILAMSFDTSSNRTTNGACHIPKVRLKMELLWVHCRHHMLELVIGAVFNRAMEPSPGSDIKIFKQF